MPDLLVCRPELAPALLDAVARARQADEDDHPRA